MYVGLSLSKAVYHLKQENLILDQNRISERAHAIWENSGKNDGAHDEHWQQACREMEAEDGKSTVDQSIISDGMVTNGMPEKI